MQLGAVSFDFEIIQRRGKKEEKEEGGKGAHICKPTRKIYF